MSFDLSGYVLRPARSASGNSTSTGEATSGVSRDHVSEAELLAAGYAITVTRPVEPYADMYRAAVLQRPDDRAGTDEYMIWAATTGSFSTVVSDAFKIAGDVSYVTAAAGTLTVTATPAATYTDGTKTFYVKDSGGRDLDSVTDMYIRRGDTGAIVTCAFESPQDPLIGKVVLDAATLAPITGLDGGFSTARRDVILTVSYILSGPTFWWSRNDADTLRFGWDGDKNRWAPYKGSQPQNLGAILEDPDQTYALTPPVTRFSIGDILPGDPLTPDAFALIRAGVYSDATSVPVKVGVVADVDTESTYPTGSPYNTYEAIVGVNNGIVLVNPTYSATNVGITLWYNPESFNPNNDGDLGKLADLATDSSLGFPVLAPIPGPTERPFVRLGFRRHLTPVPQDNDAALPASPSAVTEGEFHWSRSTGKIVLSDADIKKAQPGETGYDIAYLEASIFYDGVSMSTQPVSGMNPLPCIDEDGQPLEGDDGPSGFGVQTFGDIYIQRAVALPPPGSAGILYVPDETGDSPNLTTAPYSPNARPNGSGLVRKPQGIGDTFLFATSRAIPNLEVVEFETDIPVLKIRVKKTEAVTSKMETVNVVPDPVGGGNHAGLSRVQLKRRGLRGDALYFASAQVTPSVFSDTARLYARFGEDYVLTGSEVLRFKVDADTYIWLAATNLNAGTFTAQQIADDLNTFMTGAGTAGVVRGRVYIEADTPASGSVEIGWNEDPNDLSGHAALGFLPGWRVDYGVGGDAFRWQPDNGASIGLFRSPENLDRSNQKADIKAVGLFNNELLTNNVPAGPFIAISNPPLEDIPGYDDGVHFRCSLGLNLIRLSNYGTTQGIGVKYDWVNGRFQWTEKGEFSSTSVLTPTSVLQLENTNVIPETLSSDAMAPTGTGYGLYLKEAGTITYNEQTRSQDFVMPSDGAPGQAYLISPEGGTVASGGGGSFAAGTGPFSNPVLSTDATQNDALQIALRDAVDVGDRLQVINGDAKGLYTVTSKALVSSVAEFGVSPAFPVAGSGVSWRVLEGQLGSVYDPTIIADVQRVPFSHYKEEPFQIRLLSSAGVIGTDTLSVFAADAVASNRPVAIRFGLAVGASSATVSYLTAGTDLGTLAATGITLVDLTDSHFTTSGATGYFQIRVGAQKYSTSLGNMTLVDTFSGTIAAGEIEVGKDGSSGSIDGEVRFAADVLSGFEAETVYYDQLFLDPTSLAAGTCEINTSDGLLNLSSTDLGTHVDLTAYFVEQMVTERRLDVTVSPMNGAIYFSKPLREFQIVEAAYYQADTDGDAVLDDAGNTTLITEYLPLIVRLEEATLVDAYTYTYNPTSRTLSSAVTSFVWVGVELQNFGGPTQVTIADGVLSFVGAVAATDTVKINYGVLEAFGGEQAYQVSTLPVYRKPFFIEADATSSTFEGDRTDELGVGQLVSLGPVPFYVKSVSYDAGTDITTAAFWPPPLEEAGSRSPGNDAVFTRSSSPVAITVDPAAPVAGGGSEGFLLSVNTSSTPMLDADRGQTEFVFYGDMTAYTKVDHLLEVGGYPYFIVDTSLSEDGRYTHIKVSTTLYKGYSSTDTVRVSARPVYGSLPVSFAGISAYLLAEAFDLYLLGTLDASGTELPGRELVEGVHYQTDPSTGAVDFIDPNQKGLKKTESLVATYTALRTVQPVVDEAAILAPSFYAKYLFATYPSASNRILGSTLTAKLTYASPDSFYYETLTLVDYLGDVAGVALANASSNRSSGASVAFPGLPDNSTQGVLGLRGEVRDLKDLDRAARSFIELYNGVILSFEQVLEAIDGRIIGDRDGKFRFFIGRNKRYVRPGYEDQITGDISPRLIWRYVVDAWAEADLGIGYYTEEDPAYDPLTAVEKDAVNKPGETDGIVPNPHILRFFTDQQRKYIKNDMDDRLLIGFARFRGFAALFPSLFVPGLFKDMWQAHIYSRLFPERSTHFSRLLPGLQAVSTASGFTDAGFYSSGRKIPSPGPEPGEVTTQIIKTRKTAIGKIANPALGDISNIVEVLASNRLARARIWGYYPDGLPAAMDTALGVTTAGIATMIATPMPLGEFPVDPVTGYPDISQLIYDPLPANGTIPSVFTGDPDLSTPGFEENDRIQFGTPDGSVYELSDKDGNGVYVGAPLVGCVLTLQDNTGSNLAGSGVFVNETILLQDLVSDGTGRGDTVFVGPPVVPEAEIPDDTAAPTIEETAAAAAGIPDYRIQFDLKVGKRTGEFIDNSLPTRDDAFILPLQNMFGQMPPSPLTCIEGEVQFVNTDRKPTKLPCLKGEAADDSGDVQIPYMVGSKTELLVLGEVAAQFKALLGSDSAVATYGTQLWKAIYPDEIVVSDGEFNEFYTPTRDPATLYTTRDLTPVATSGYTDDSAVGDARPFDLMLVEVGQPLAGGELNTGMTGVLAVGAISGSASLSSLEPPRFVTPIKEGGTHYYTVRRAFGHNSGGGTSGAELTETVGGTTVLTIDCTSVGGLVFSSDPGVATGGVLDLLGSGNALVVRFYDPDALAGSALLGTITIYDIAAGNVDAKPPVGAAVNLTLAGTGVTLSDYGTISIETTASILTQIPLLATATTYDFTVTVDTEISAETALVSTLTANTGVGSTTSWIDEDRLTFHERICFAAALPRGSTPANGEAIELGAELAVWKCTVGGGVDCTVNAPAEVNGGDYFTFLERFDSGSGQPYVGSFAPNATASLADGSLKVMAWEGFNNDPLPYTVTPVSNVVLSAVPSSDLNETGVILDGTGVFRDDVDSAGTYTVDGARHWLDNVAVSAGGLVANVVAGDTIVVDGSSVAGEGAVAAGTYLVRHVVDTDGTTSFTDSDPLRASELYSDAGRKGGLDLTFPTVKSADGSALTLTVRGVPSVLYSSNGTGDPQTGHGFLPGDGATTYVYLVLKNEYTSWNAAYTMDAAAVYRMLYDSVTIQDSTGEITFTLTTGTAEDATGTALDAVAATSDAIFIAAATAGLTVSGMTRFPVTPPVADGFAKNNTVGWLEDDGVHNPGVGEELTGGFLMAVAGNRGSVHTAAGGVTTNVWDKSVSQGDITRLPLPISAAGADKISVRIPAASDSTDFYADRETVVYNRTYISSGIGRATAGVPSHIDISGWSATVWDNVHFEAVVTGPPTNRVYCLLPKDRIIFGSQLETGGSPGFFALAGIFLEPSFPRPTTDLNLAFPHVVSEGHLLTGQTDQVAHRNFSDFGFTASEESVHFKVRRIRRFHDVQTKISDNLGELRYVYELRKGDFVDGTDGSYNTSTRVFTAGSATYGAATNVGAFNNKKVNIHPGDVLRILDANGALIDSADVQKVTGAGTLLLRRPGLTETLSSAVSFEVYLEQAIIPQEQSAEMLLSLVTDTEVYRRTVAYTGSPDGGAVSEFNKMQDTAGLDWAAVGVLEGDYVVVDPAGTLFETTEAGKRPSGDVSTILRAEYLAGAPSNLDDNRGFYKVTTVESGDLTVDGASRFGGGNDDGGDDIVMGDPAASPNSSEYVVLPTIHDSDLTDGSSGPLGLGRREGQQALRPTAAAVGTSFAARTSLDAFKSIEPFPYRIIRPNSIFSEDALELVLFNRERLLSWIEEMKSVYVGRGGDYWVFQDEDHIEDVGSPTDPTAGAGIISNLVISSLAGLVDDTPYTNVGDCLSILGRRFWILDTRLDEEGYTSFATDAWGQRPVLPDLVEDVLNLDDRFRDMRFSWVRFRADQVTGSIIKARRAEDDLPDELAKQQELIDQQTALDDS